MTIFKTARGRVSQLPALIKHPVPIQLEPSVHDGVIVIGVDNRLYVSNGTAWRILNGLNAYELAVENGFVGTELEWLESISEEANIFANQSALSAANSANTSEFWALFSQSQADRSANNAGLSEFWFNQTVETANDAISYVNSANSTLEEINDTIEDTRTALFSLTLGFINTQTRAIEEAIFVEQQLNQLNEIDNSLANAQIDLNTRYIGVIDRLDNLEEFKTSIESTFTSIETNLENLSIELDNLIPE